MNLRRSVSAFLGLSLALLAAVAGSLQAQTPPAQQQANRGSITGIVKDQESGAPLAQVTVSIVGTAVGAASGPDGRYVIPNVPPGIHTLEAKRLGYSPTTVSSLRVEAGAPTVRDITVAQNALTLNAVLSTGLADPTAGTKAPFSVAQISGDKLNVTPIGSALEVLNGKVAGLTVRGGTMPGSDVVIQIRNPLSITGFTQPMIIVDGVIQMQDDPSLGAASIRGNPLDLDPETIESIEVVRGAAAAALYGQRAANGVINITTKRGGDVGVGTTRLTLSSDVGLSQLGNGLNQTQHHAMRVNENNQFIDSFGRVLGGSDNPGSTGIQRGSLNNAVEPYAFMDNEFGVPVYDNVAALFGTGSSLRTNMSMAQSALATNFSISAGATNETGIVVVNSGTSRQNLGMNLDYRARTNLQAGIGMSYLKSFTRQLTTLGSMLLTVQDIAKTTSITELDPSTGKPFRSPDDEDSCLDGTCDNPLFIEPNRDEWDKRTGAQANVTGTVRPSSVFSISAQGGYQRSEAENQEQWVPLGTVYTGGSIAGDGRYDISTALDESFNTSLRGGILKGFGGWTVRAGLRTGGQLQRRNEIGIEGDSLTANQRDFDLLKIYDVDQVTRDARFLDWSANVAFDFNQRYIVDVVYRADGSSLLPPNTRWQSNGRASFAYSMSDEPWWPLGDVTLFKPRYSIGTAGNNPPLAARYELYSAYANSDRVAKQNLGNVNIVPEEVTEQELGLDVAWRNRYSLSLTYVLNRVKNIIRADTILAFGGFETQESNLGDLEGYTYEATFETQWIQKRDVQWSSTLVADHGRQKIVNYPRRCNNIANTTTLNRICEGYVFGQQYSFFVVRTPQDLNPVHTTNSSLHQFDVNDEGLLVAVGEIAPGVGGSWTDGRWGQIVNIDGINYGWGMPIRASTYDPLTGSRTGSRQKILGMGIADVALGLNNQVRYKRLTLSAQVNAQLGGTVWNSARQGEMGRQVAAELDQFGKPEHMKKPIEYYMLAQQTSGGGGNWGGLTQNVRNQPVDMFIEPGTFVKLSEMRVAYRLDQGIPLLRNLGMTSGSIAFVSRDLFTITNYSGYDPEVAGATSFTSARTDAAATLPPFRNLAINVRLVF